MSLICRACSSRVSGWSTTGCRPPGARARPSSRTTPGSRGASSVRSATFLLAETMGKQKAGKLVEEALAKGGSFVEALGQLEKELSDEAALLGYSPKFVDRLLAELKRK